MGQFNFLMPKGWPIYDWGKPKNNQNPESSGKFENEILGRPEHISF